VLRLKLGVVDGGGLGQTSARCRRTWLRLISAERTWVWADILLPWYCRWPGDYDGVADVAFLDRNLHAMLAGGVFTWELDAAQRNHQGEPPEWELDERGGPEQRSPRLSGEVYERGRL